MLYLIKLAVKNETEDRYDTETIGVEEYDIKPEKGDLITLKDGRQFTVIGVAHQSKMFEANPEDDIPTTILIVMEQGLTVEE